MHYPELSFAQRHLTDLDDEEPMAAPIATTSPPTHSDADAPQVAASESLPLDFLATANYPELLAIARRELHRLRNAATLDTRAVLHEAFLRLVNQRQQSWEDRPHFLAAAASMMRRVLVDHVRRRYADKRDHGRRPITLDEQLAPINLRDDSLAALDDALTALAQFSPRLAKVVECRYFGGMTEAETAAALSINERTVRRDWIKARGWLQCVLTKG
jgi:RNA polymerase sigma factor (TIGR02999 family)